jgi:hypothetical protein
VTKVPLPASSPDFKPIAYRWQTVKQRATPLQDFPACTLLQAEVETAWLHFAQTPRAIMTLMTRSCDSLGALAA